MIGINVTPYLYEGLCWLLQTTCFTCVFTILTIYARFVSQLESSFTASPIVSIRALIQWVFFFLAYFSFLSLITTVCWAGNTKAEGEDRYERSSSCHIGGKTVVAAIVMRGNWSNPERSLARDDSEQRWRQIGLRRAEDEPDHWESFNKLLSLHGQGSQTLYITLAAVKGSGSWLTGPVCCYGACMSTVIWEGPSYYCLLLHEVDTQCY